MVLAFIFLTTKPNSMLDILGILKTIDGVEEASMVYGVYDIVAKIRADNIRELKELVSKRIDKIKNIQTLITIIVEAG